MKEQIISALIEFGVPVLATALSAIASLIGYELKKLIAAKVKDQKLKTAFAQLTDVVETTVDKLAQTAAQEIKARNGGKLTKVDKVQLRDKALTAVFQQVPDDAKKALGMDGLTLQDFVSSKIEQAVYKQKKAVK